MAKEWAKSFYNSKAWKRCRASYIAQRVLIDGGTCEECKECPGYILHHKTTLTPANIGDPDIALNHCNLQYVCKECHDRFDGHGAGQLGKELLIEFGVHGQPLPPLKER